MIPASLSRFTRRRHVAGETCTWEATAWLDTEASVCNDSNIRTSVASRENSISDPKIEENIGG
jgi:hypothetical protein